jgi:hypothetical protein
MAGDYLTFGGTGREIDSARANNAAREDATTLCRMCRSIHTLHNLEPHASQEEVRAAALQYVRKLSGYTKPSRANEAAFDRAVEAVAAATHELLDALVTNAPPKDREVEAAKKRAAFERRQARAVA